MISPEFTAAIQGNDLLQAKVMLKNSLQTDQTFQQFDEMLAYAKNVVPDIIVPYDGKKLEMDSSRWNQGLMNLEMIQLINNFSKERVEHLKKVISKVMANEANEKHEKETEKKVKQEPATQTSKTPQKPSGSDSGGRKPSELVMAEVRKRHQTRAMNKMVKAAAQVSEILQKAPGKGKRWRMEDIKKMENAAKQILEATRELQSP